ncbi:MAG: C25 family cysteine peptidase, partial [Candidatus Eiseniibacteriota bacterium]
MSQLSGCRAAAILWALLVALGPGAIEAHATTATTDALAQRLEFDAAAVQLSATADGDRVRLPGLVTGRGEPGAPDLPVRVLMLELPAGTSVADVRVEVLDTVRVGSGLDPVPVTADYRIGTAPPAARRDAALYDAGSADATYPAVHARYLGRGALRGHTIATVEVTPWNYRPETGELELVTRLDLRLELEPAPPIGLPRHRIDARIERRFERQASRVVSGGLTPLTGAGSAAGAAPLAGEGPAGPGPFQPTFRPTTDGSAVEYVIVTSEALAPQFERLADWKTRKGVQAVVRTTAWIDATYPNGVDRAERVRFFLRDAYQNWGTLWVLLGGDTDVVPLRYGETTLLGGESIPADYYYACLDTNWNGDGDDRFGEGWVSPEETGDDIDLTPELYVGRAPVSTEQSASIFIDKLLAYEQNPASGNGYPASVLFMAERLFSVFHGAEVAEQASAFLGIHAPWLKRVRLYEESASWPGSIELDRATAIDSLTDGFGIVHHVGHGFRNTMSVGDGTLTNADADNLTNGPRQSFVFAINCSSASIDFNSIGERFVKNPDGGAIGYLGTSRFAFVNASRDIQEDWYALVFEDSVRALGEAATLSRLPLIAASEFDNAFRWTQF